MGYDKVAGRRVRRGASRQGHRCITSPKRWRKAGSRGVLSEPRVALADGERELGPGPASQVPAEEWPAARHQLGLASPRVKLSAAAEPRGDAARVTAGPVGAGAGGGSRGFAWGLRAGGPRPGCSKSLRVAPSLLFFMLPAPRLSPFRRPRDREQEAASGISSPVSIRKIPSSHGALPAEAPVPGLARSPQLREGRHAVGRRSVRPGARRPPGTPQSQALCPLPREETGAEEA